VNFRASLIAAALPALLTAGGLRAQDVSRQTTDAFVRQFESSDESDLRDWKLFKSGQTGQLERLPDVKLAWLQPANKKEACKVHAADSKRWWDDRDNRIFWDGACRDGFAQGLGREFVVRNGELASWLAAYKQPNTPPEYFLITHYDRQTVQFRAHSENFVAALDYGVAQEQDIKYLAVTKSMLDLSGDRLYRERRTPGGDRLVRELVLPNKNGYRFQTKVDPLSKEAVYTTRDGKGKNIGYVVGAQEVDGSWKVRHFDASSDRQAKEVRLPQEYLTHLATAEATSAERLRMADKLLEESFVAINIYKRRICEGTVSVDYVSPEIYGRICLDGGELSSFSKLVAQTQEQQKTRHAQMRDELSRRRQEAAPQVEQSRPTARQEEQRPDYSGLGRAISEFAGSMAELQQRSSEFTQSYMNSFNPTGISAPPGGGRTTCVLVSNVVNCRSR
jgi:hypothetical protein